LLQPGTAETVPIQKSKFPIVLAKFRNSVSGCNNSTAITLDRSQHTSDFLEDFGSGGGI
jgi:hypothetical protein